MFTNPASALFQALHGMLHFPSPNGAGCNYECAIRNRFRDTLKLFGAGENVSRADCGTSFTKSWPVGIHHT